jgi:hypothetical protein
VNNYNKTNSNSDKCNFHVCLRFAVCLNFIVSVVDRVNQTALKLLNVTRESVLLIVHFKSFVSQMKLIIM